MEAAQKIRREMKVRKYGSGGGGSVRQVKLSPDVNTNGGAGVEGRTGSSARSKSLVRLRDVRETDLGPRNVLGGGFHLQLCLPRGRAIRPDAIWNMELLGSKSW